MAAINMNALVARTSAELLSKRSNWASQNVGPMVVFCILGAVALLLIFLFTSKYLSKRRASR